MKRSAVLAGMTLLAAVAAAPQAAHAALIHTDTSWRAIAPVGNQQGSGAVNTSPLNSVGLDWEAANPGWNSSAGYVTAGWGHASTAYTPYPNTVWGPTDDDTPVYFRYLFTLDTPPAHATLSGGQDDDIIVWINGQEAYSDLDGHETHFGDVDITHYLKAGLNLFAIKAQDSYGQNQYLDLNFAIDGAIATPVTTMVTPIPPPCRWAASR